MKVNPCGAGAIHLQLFAASYNNVKSQHLPHRDHETRRDEKHEAMHVARLQVHLQLELQAPPIFFNL
jgi:hypothetical protein